MENGKEIKASRDIVSWRFNNCDLSTQHVLAFCRLIGVPFNCLVERQKKVESPELSQVSSQHSIVLLG